MNRPWRQHYDPGVPPTLTYPELSLDGLLARAAARHPHHPATLFGGLVGPWLVDGSLSYRRLNRLVDRFAAGLQQLGVQPGDRVAVMLPNCPQFVIAAYAIWRSGGILVCCSPLYAPREIAHLVQDAGCTTMIVTSHLLCRVQQIQAAVGLRRVIVTRIKRYLPAPARLLFTLLKEGPDGHRVQLPVDGLTCWFRQVLAHGSAAPAAVTVDPNQVATLVYTGGTTGAPKGVQLTHRNTMANGVMLNAWIQAREAGEIMVAAMPFFHAYGLTVGLVAPVVRAGTILLIPDPRLLPHILKSVARHRATLLPAVPTLFVGLNQLLARTGADLSSLRFAACSAAPLPPEVQARFEEHTGCQMVEAYGLTEAGVTATLDPLGRPRRHTAGVPLPDTDVAIVDLDTGREPVPTGEVGEIIIRGPQVMSGYWRQPEATAAVLRQGPDGRPGWLYTGDIGALDADGYLHITDRKKDMIIASGYNVYPANVEAILYEHPAVAEAAVVGVPDPRRGETVKACVVLKPGQSATAAEIIAFCRQNMAAYKAPRIVEFHRELPHSAVGKVLRRQLKEPIAAG